MSYFKPLNSIENNLHVIRVTIDPKRAPTYIKTGSVGTNSLPSTFNVKYFPMTINTPEYLQVNYPNIFNNSLIPSVFITPILGNNGTKNAQYEAVIKLFVMDRGTDYCKVSTNDFLNTIYEFDIFECFILLAH
jgi:hypothetical protein